MSGCPITNFLILDEREHQLYMQETNAVIGILHEVDRNNLFEDVIDLYGEGEIVGEYPIFVKYKDEIGIDEGGLSRDMFTSILNYVRRLYKPCSNGSSPDKDVILFHTW